MSDSKNTLWLADALNVTASNFRLIQSERNEITHAPFLDGRFSKGRDFRETSFTNADKLISAKTLRPPAYIFHTGFCCSSLLARALDRAGAIYSLKEPNLMMELANARRTGPWSKDVSRFRSGMSRALDLLAALAPPEETPLVKFTNSANNLLPLILEAKPDAKILILHSDLESFLISVLKKGEEGRRFIRFMFNTMTFDANWTKNMEPRDQMRLTDLQIAALVWRLQTNPVREAKKFCTEQQMRSLHVDQFLANPDTILASVSWFLGLDFPQSAINQVIEGPILKGDPEQEEKGYDTNLRTSEMQNIKQQFAADIDITLQWARHIPLGGFDNGKFPNPLIDQN